jgi:hypothetical protein
MAVCRISATNFNRTGNRVLDKAAIESLPWTRHEWIV